MIVDNLYTSRTDYGSMSPKLARALEWLKANDLRSLEPDQTITVDGARISAQIQAYDSILPQDTRFEAHRSYIDIQIVLSGKEIVYWCPLERLTKIAVPYDYEKDIVFFDDPDVPSTPMRLEAGDYAVLFPSDGHKPRCVVDAPEPVGKIVVKVSVQ